MFYGPLVALSILQTDMILSLYRTEEVLGFIKEINDFVTETKLPQKTPEALIITEFN